MSVETYDLERLEKLVHKSIDTYSDISGRVGGMEESVKLLREDLRDIRNDNRGFMERISANLATLTEIQNANETGHKVLHTRVDQIKDELDEVQKAVNSVKLVCAGVNHSDLVKRVDAMERSLKSVLEAMRLFSFKIKGVPLSLVLTAILIFTFFSTIYNHYPWMMNKIFDLVK